MHDDLRKTAMTTILDLADPSTPVDRDHVIQTIFKLVRSHNQYEDDVLRAIRYASSAEVPHAAVTQRAIDNLAKMTPDQIRQTFVDAGIVTKKGKLRKAYR